VQLLLTVTRNAMAVLYNCHTDYRLLLLLLLLLLHGVSIM
jgi:hypothetical protein